MVCQTATAKKKKNRNRNKQKPATSIENGDASSTTSTVNDGLDSMDHTSETTPPISEATDTRLPQLSVTSTADSGKPEVISVAVNVSNGSVKSDPGPVYVHVGDMTSGALPNGFVNTGSKLVTNSTASKGHQPMTLGRTLCYYDYCTHFVDNIA